MTKEPDTVFADAPLPAFKQWCRVCERVGKKRWPRMGLLDALISPHGTAHFQKDDGFETTVCGLDATRGNWRWPE
jgi:hypothetical protein